MRTKCTQHCVSICEFIVDPAHPFATGAIGGHGHLRCDALLFAAEGHAVKTAGQNDLQVSAPVALDPLHAVGKLNAAARIRIGHSKAAVAMRALVDPSHLDADHGAIADVQRILDYWKPKID